MSNEPIMFTLEQIQEMDDNMEGGPYGVGYWTVLTIQTGTIYQGVGRTLAEAYGEYIQLLEQHHVA